jgi:hypothetical protein
MGHISTTGEQSAGWRRTEERRLNAGNEQDRARAARLRSDEQQQYERIKLEADLRRRKAEADEREWRCAREQQLIKEEHDLQQQRRTQEIYKAATTAVRSRTSN